MTNKEEIEGALIVVSSLQGFVFFEISDVRNKKKDTVKETLEEGKENLRIPDLALINFWIITKNVIIRQYAGYFVHILT